MVALRSAVLPPTAELFGHLSASWDDLPAMADVQRENDIITVRLASGVGAVALIPAPIPWEELEAPCARARWYWSEAAEEMRTHQAHIIVSVSGADMSLVDAAYRVTQLAAGVSAMADAVGVYWGAGGVVQSARAFAGIAGLMSRESLPLPLWLGIHGREESDGGQTLWTRGLAAFDFMELEIVGSRAEPDLIYERALDVAHYLLDHGPVLGDGDTIGVTADERLLVRHLPSVVEPERMVYRVEL